VQLALRLLIPVDRCCWSLDDVQAVLGASTSRRSCIAGAIPTPKWTRWRDKRCASRRPVGHKAAARVARFSAIFGILSAIARSPKTSTGHRAP